MTSCTIIISHYESWTFLKACLRQINKFRNENIRQQIIVCDQSETSNFSFDEDTFGLEDEITVIKTNPYYSGYGIDYVLRNVEITGDYICQLHADCVPISDKYLSLPIKLIENLDLSFVGQLQFICSGKEKIYPPTPFCAIAQCFNVARRETYKELSLNAGFARFHNRTDENIAYTNHDWADWAKHDYQKRGSDDDVVAFHWQDKYRRADKLGLAITGMIGTAENGGSWGRVIDDLVFHFGSANEARGVMDKMPMLYRDYTQLINEEGLSQKLLQELLSQVKPYKSDRTFWDGINKIAIKSSDILDNKIELLKHGLE